MFPKFLSKRVISLFCFLYLYSSSYCQNYFSNRYDFYNQNNGSISFILLNDTFFVNVQLLSSGESTLGKIDSDGNLTLLNKYAAGFGGSYYFSNAVMQYKNNIYTTGGGGYYNKISSPLYKHNYNGDTLHTNYFGDTAYYCLMQKIIPYYKTKDKLLLIGTTDSTCGPGHQSLYKPIIRVVDTNGVLCQTNIYLNNCYYRNVTSVDTAENKGFLIGYGGMFNTWDAESRVMKLDSNLNTIWNTQINITSGGEPVMVNHKNQYYTVVSTKVDSVWNFTYKWERVSLTRLGLNGNIIWQKYYGIKERPMLTSGLRECANGDYIMCGSRRTSANELQGWIMRIDSAGNQKWWRNYRPQTSPILDTLSDNYLHDIIELPNGDISAVGWSGPSAISSKQQTWLLKLDSNGCFGFGNCNPNLATGIGEIDNTSSLEDYIKVSPNPFSNNLKVSYALHNVNNSLIEFNLIELATGKIIVTQSSLKNQDNITFNTVDIASGVYLFNVRNNGKNIKNIKVVNIK